MSLARQKVYGKIGLCCLCYYALTYLLAGLTGIAVAVLIKPGEMHSGVTAPPDGQNETLHTVDAFLDLIRWLEK